MPCTTVLAGKKATNDNSTMIARTDDGRFDVKNLIVVTPDKQPRKYKSVLSHVEIDLPDDPMRYTASPNVIPGQGIWAATGINEANVGMTATETITSNPRVLAADPLVIMQKPKSSRGKTIPGGIGEEDILTLVLPYIRSAREGVLRLASLLEEYGTYESNGIAFNDENEIWWMETIGGHHWMAKRVPDEVVVMNPNQFGMDSFDLDDALGKQISHMCSPDLKEFIEANHLDLNQDGKFNPRDIFGSHTSKDHIYNTPRAWSMGRYLTPYSHKWDGPEAEFGPESDNLPWALVPDRKVAAEDIQHLLSLHFQGTPYDPYTSHDTGVRGMYRSIGINRTSVTSICQIRSDVPDKLKGIEWICFGSTTFSPWVPVYANTDKLPAYFSKVSADVSTDNLYWASRLIGAMADKSYAKCIQDVERYQNAVNTECRRLIKEYDERMKSEGDFSLVSEANSAITEKTRELVTITLNKILQISMEDMKNGYDRADN